jgi:hypothetical protein
MHEDTTWAGRFFLGMFFLTEGYGLYRISTRPWPSLFMMIFVGGLFLFMYLVGTQERREARKQERAIAAQEEEKNRIRQREEEKKLNAEEYNQRSLLRIEIESMPKHATWRSSVISRSGKKCEICGDETGLEIHHKKSFDSIIRKNQLHSTFEALECDELWDVTNGSVLCKSCHSKMPSSVYRASMQ